MLLIILWIIAAALVIGDLVHRYLKATQITKRGKLQNRDRAVPGSEIIKTEPRVVGTKRSKHYIYVVTFADGTVYQDVCGIRDPQLGKHGMRFDNSRAEEIVKKAAEAHERAAGAGSL